MGDHTISMDVARFPLSNSVEVTYENRFNKPWSYFVTAGYLYSSPGDEFFGPEEIVYRGRNDPRIDEGFLGRVGANFDLLSFKLWSIPSVWQLSGFIGYRYSYFYKKMVCDIHCPPNFDCIRTEIGTRTRETYQLTIESAKRQDMKSGLINRFRFTFWSRIMLDLWFGLKAGYRWGVRTIHEDIPPHYAVNSYHPNLLEYYCLTNDCPINKKIQNTYIQAIGGFRIGYTFD
jgi:hypothetical protein